MTLDAELIWSASAGLIAAVVSGVLGVIAGSKRAKADVQAAIVSGFQGLIDQLQEERRNDRAEIANLRVEIAQLRAYIEGATGAPAPLILVRPNLPGSPIKSEHDSVKNRER